MRSRRPLSTRPALALASALALALAGEAAAQDPSCADSGDVGYVCGLNNPEDLLRVPGSPYVLTGNMGTPDSERGGFYEVDARSRAVRDVPPDLSGSPRPEYRDCPGPPDAELLASHGIELTSRRISPEEGLEHTVYAVNHGGRESIEVFRLDAGAGGLRLAWIGCVVLPDGLAANSVAALPQGGFVTTVPVRSEAELLSAGMGRPTGTVLRWTPGQGWAEVPGVESSFPNGILVSPDGAWIYVGAYTEQAVVKVSLGREPVERSEVAVPFNPDNLRWSPRGEILATGQDAEPAEVQFTCVQSDVETCQVPTAVAKVDPATLAATQLYDRPGDERFGAGTSSIVIGEELWIGSFRAQRLLRVPLRALAAPLQPEVAGPPQLRLTRQCRRNGRLRVAIAGEVERVRAVSFKLGKRLAERDETFPFRRLIARRGTDRKPADRLRAVAHLADGGRVILGRSLPRC